MLEFLERPLEKALFELTLMRPGLFRRIGRPVLYMRYRGNLDRIHKETIRMLNENVDILEARQQDFEFQELPSLEIEFNGRRLVPFGTAAGFDKDSEILRPLSHVTGFQEPGTVVLNPREGSNLPRKAVDKKKENLYNAEGFPGRGLEYARDRLKAYRNSSHPQKPIYVSICGIPSDDRDLNNSIFHAYEETRKLIEELNPYVDGFVWNPYSPNTAALERLRSENIFGEFAKLFAKYAPDKLRLVKMGPCEPGEKGKWLSQIGAFKDGGGHGIVAINTLKVPRREVPSRKWNSDSAGKSGRDLRAYRKRAVKNARGEFPDLVIIAVGGIFDNEDVYETLKDADGVEYYTPLIFSGLGLIAQHMKYVSSRLKTEGYGSLQDYQQYWRAVREMKLLV